MLLAVTMALFACKKAPASRFGRHRYDEGSAEYNEQTKTTEALTKLTAIRGGAFAYFESTRDTQFPALPIPPTPPLGTCCKNPKHRCDADPALWDTPAWRELRFAMEDPHRYSYAFRASGTGKAATFTVDAYGDLDCDGVYSTFELFGSVGTASWGNSYVNGDVSIVDELE